MRIISGKNRGRRIDVTGNLPVRPTTDKAKESLFNILNNLIVLAGAEVLDLFAGTGNISYEFVSRGSKFVTAVDLNNKCVNFIMKTAEKLNFENLKVVRSGYIRFIKTTKTKYDIIFADPPYDMEDIALLPELIFENSILKDEGILIVEHPGNVELNQVPGFFDHRVYGRVNFSFFEKPSK